MADRVVVVEQAPAGRAGCLGFIGNVLWLLLAGWSLFLGYLVAGVIMCITIIGIPFGVQSFKLAGYAIWPFGRRVYRTSRGMGRGVSLVGNILWLVLAGWWLALAQVVSGLLLCITILGIPFGIQCFKMAGLALSPFGRTVS